ncbi:sugar transferase [Altererythrobacter xixiisoli]|uniref:Sugar transferase n=1 Tax=Croceibacterium xixiisoli TaxID=1476466 RepID=A0A6I4TWV8_9SPHN|nr:sugar transferase [Croceibacterium xixiisoli]MXO99118.1 sugar transferase [Croceibacterium xixiisoli]
MLQIPRDISSPTVEHTTSELMTKRSRRRKLLMALVALDAAAICVAFLIAAILHHVIEKWHWVGMVAAIVPVYLAFAANSKAYSGRVFGNQRLGISRCVSALISAFGIVVLIAFLFKVSDNFSRVNFALGAVLAMFLLALVRLVFLRFLHRLFAGDPYCVVLIVDGSIPLPKGRFAATVDANDWLIGDGSVDMPALYDRLGSLLGQADRVVVACAPDRREQLVHALKGANVLAEVLTPELGGLAPLSVDRSGNVPTLVVSIGPLSPFDEFLKRSFDLIVSFLAIIALSPIMIGAAIAVKFSSKGPVLFVQQRIGHGNRVFRMLKFRSMRTEVADAKADRLVTRDDDRVTAVGRFIRKTSIDELPQLFNVLLGHMSIVGPRPHAPGAKAASKLYWEVDSRYWYRHAVKPGLTGLAQVRGWRGNTVCESDLTNRLQADLEYLHGWSLMRDMSILARTCQVVMSRNAY